jgi:hypothetical protein
MRMSCVSGYREQMKVHKRKCKIGWLSQSPIRTCPTFPGGLTFQLMNSPSPSLLLFGVVVRVCRIGSTQARAPTRVVIALRGECQVRSLLEEGVGVLYRREWRDDGGEKGIRQLTAADGTKGGLILKTIGLTQTRHYLRRDRP